MARKVKKTPDDYRSQWLTRYEATQRIGQRRAFVGLTSIELQGQPLAWVAVECLPVPLESKEIADVQARSGETLGEFAISARWEMVSAERRRRFQYVVRQMTVLPPGVGNDGTRQILERLLATLAAELRAESSKYERRPPLSLFTDASPTEPHLTEVSRALANVWGTDLIGNEASALYTVEFARSKLHSVSARTRRVRTSEAYLMDRLSALAQQGLLMATQAMSTHMIGEWITHSQPLSSGEHDDSQAVGRDQRSSALLKALSLACLSSPTVYPTTVLPIPVAQSRSPEP